MFSNNTFWAVSTYQCLDHLWSAFKKIFLNNKMQTRHSCFKFFSLDKYDIEQCLFAVWSDGAIFCNLNVVFITRINISHAIYCLREHSTIPCGCSRGKKPKARKTHPKRRPLMLSFSIISLGWFPRIPITSLYYILCIIYVRQCLCYWSFSNEHWWSVNFLVSFQRCSDTNGWMNFEFSTVLYVNVKTTGYVLFLPSKSRWYFPKRSKNISRDFGKWERNLIFIDDITLELHSSSFCIQVKSLF